MNRASGACGTITKDLTFVPSKFQNRRKKECGAEKELKEIMAENIPNLARNINIEIQRAEQTRQNKAKEIHRQTHHY